MTCSHRRQGLGPSALCQRASEQVMPPLHYVSGSSGSTPTRLHSVVSCLQLLHCCSQTLKLLLYCRPCCLCFTSRRVHRDAGSLLLLWVLQNLVSAHLGGWCRRGVPVVLWVLEATRRRSCGRREPREGYQSRRGACEGTEGRGRGVDSTSRVRGPPGRPYLLVWDQTLITLSSTFVERLAQKIRGVRAPRRANSH